MAKSIDISARITGLERALERAKALGSDDALDAVPMAQLTGVTWAALRNWLDTFPEFDGTDCFVRGGQGIAWAIKPKATIEKLIEHFNAERDRRATRTREVGKQVGLETNDEAPQDINELAKQVNLTLVLTEAKEKQRGYIPTQQFVDFIVGYNTANVEGVLGVKAQIDSTGSLPPEIIVQIDEHLRNVAVGMSNRARQFIKDFDARLDQSGDRGNS